MNISTGPNKHIEFVEPYPCYPIGTRKVFPLDVADSLISQGFAVHVPDVFDAAPPAKGEPAPPDKPIYFTRPKRPERTR